MPEIMDELEVLIVNDGSIDETSNIAHEYEKRYPQTFRLFNKENGGYGTTVNLGIKEATGRYFKLLDGDDWFDKEGLKKLILELKKTSADVVITPMNKGADVNTMKECPIDLGALNEDMSIEQMPKTNLFGMWTITYKTEVLHNSGLKLPAHLLYTDQIFASVPWICVKTIRFMNKAVYCYRIGRDGQSVSRESRIKHCSDSVEVNKALIRFYESDQNAKECTASEYIVRRISMYSIEVLRTFMLGEVSRENCKKVRDYDNYVKRESPDIYTACCELKFKMSKLLCLMRKTNYIVYYLLALVPGGMPNWG